jgi:glutamate-1-semialdehyde 2,1-aminomutase
MHSGTSMNAANPTSDNVLDSASAELFARACRVIPGGVNSPVRAFRSVGGQPVFIDRAEGSYLYGANGAKYIDFIGSWGPMILGHAHPEVKHAILTAVERGTSYGAPTALEVEFAETLTRLYPSMEMVRAVSSGTEATMAALRVARGFTGRERIVKFEGCYHGHADFLLVKAGSGALTLGHPDSAGVPAATASATLTLPYNDIALLEQCFKTYGSTIAAVIVEPVVGNMGCVAPGDGFLQAILDQCKLHGAVSIFDEVMTGSRLALGGAQERFGLRPDMTCLGKVVGGGLPLAAYGGRREIMNCVAPLGAVYQAGTLSGNPIAVTAGLTTLGLLSPEVYGRLEQIGATLEAGINRILQARGVSGCVQRVGSMLTLFFCKGPVTNLTDASQSDTRRFGKFHQALLAQGIYWPPSQFEAAFLNVAMSDEDVQTTLTAFDQALASSTLHLG